MYNVPLEAVILLIRRRIARKIRSWVWNVSAGHKDLNVVEYKSSPTILTEMRILVLSQAVNKKFFQIAILNWLSRLSSEELNSISGFHDIRNRQRSTDHQFGRLLQTVICEFSAAHEHLDVFDDEKGEEASFWRIWRGSEELAVNASLFFWLLYQDDEEIIFFCISLWPRGLSQT